MRFFSFLKGYKKETVLAPVFKLLEALFELCVPLAVASLIDNGIAKGDMHHVLVMALVMVSLGVIGLISSVTAQYFAAKAATGFAVKMKKMRTKMELTQAEFAAMVGISEEEVSLIEREKLTDIKLSTLQKVAAMTGLTVSELLSVEPEEDSELVGAPV